MKRSTIMMVILGLIVSLFALPTFAQDATPTETTPDMTTTEESTSEQPSMMDDDLDGPEAYLRVLHFIPDAGAVDVYINNEMSDIESSEYLGASEWHTVPAGTHTLAVAPTGSSADEVLASSEITLSEGDFVTLGVSANADGTPSLQIIRSDFSEQLPGVAVVNFVNAMTGSRAVNFLRDDVVFVANVGPSSSVGEIQNAIPVDVATYIFSVDYSDTEEAVNVDPIELDVVATNNYLFVIAGTEENPELVMYETERGDVRVLRDEIEAPGTVVEALAALDVATVNQALSDTGLAETLSGEGPFTVFVPADYLQDELSASSEDMTALLQNHVVEGNLKLSDLVDMGSVTTLAGNTLEVTAVDNTVMVGNATILTTNIAATNGTVHVIDNILSTNAETE